MKGHNDIVNLLDLDNEFIIDIKYATEDNFTKVKLYKSSKCYINKNTAELLIKAKEIFKKDGYRVKVWDAYRPISAQRLMFEVYPDNNFVAMAPDMSKPIKYRCDHMNGMSVDITLVDKNGQDIPMPTGFDDFTENAGLRSDKIPTELRKNAEYLKSVMESVGFEYYDYEWWHFNDNVNEPIAYLDIELD